LRFNKNRSKLKLPLLFTLLLPVYLSSFAQTSEVKGRVVDANYKPVEFATVLLQNLSRSTFTDSAGYFFFRLPRQYASPEINLKIAVIGKKTIEKTVPVSSVMTVFVLEDESLTLSEVEINQVRKKQQSNSSIVFDRPALDQIQAFSLADVLNNLPGKKTLAPNLQSPQTITLRTEATGLQAMNNSFGTAIIVDDIQLSNNANMQNRSVGKFGVSGSEIGSQKYGTFDTPFSGLDIRDIPVDNIESIEVITGVASAKYGDLTSGAVIINRQAGKSSYQFSTRINGASTNLSLSKGYVLDKKWGALNMSVNYLSSLDDPSDLTKKYTRVNANVMWTSYLFKNFKNTMSVDYSTRFDDVKLDPDDDLLLKSFAKSRSYSISNRSSLNLEGIVAKRIDMSIGYSNTYSETYSQRQLNNSPIAIVDKDTTNAIYEGYLIPGNYTSVEHVKGNPVNLNGNLGLANEIYTGSVLHQLSIGANIYYAQNHGQGIIVDTTVPRWANQKYQNERPYSYKSLPDIFNYGVYLQDNFKLKILRKDLTFNPGLRYDVQNGQANLQPRLNMSYTLNNKIELNAAYGISTKGPSLAHRYPSPVYVDIPIKSVSNGSVNESLALFYTDRILPDNGYLKSSQSNQLELGIRISEKLFSTSIFGYYKKDKDGFSTKENFKVYTLPEYTITTLTGGKPIATPNGNYFTRIATVNTVGNSTNSDNYGLEWSISSKKVKAIETSITLNNSFNYSYFKLSEESMGKANQAMIDAGKNAWIAVYAPTELVNWNLMSKVSTATHIPQLGFVINLLADISWMTRQKTNQATKKPIAWLDKDLNRYEIPVFDPQNEDYGYLANNSGSDSEVSIPFPVANLSIRIAKEIKKKIRLSINANNFLNVKTRYYNPITESVQTFSVPTSVGAELSIKF